MTAIDEFLYLWDHQKHLFDPTKKQLVMSTISARHLSIILEWQHLLQRGALRCSCPVDVWTSDKSVYWKSTNHQDNAVDVDDITRYLSCMGDNVQHHIRKNTIHNQFIQNVDEILRVCPPVCVVDTILRRTDPKQLKLVSDVVHIVLSLYSVLSDQFQKSIT